MSFNALLLLLLLSMRPTATLDFIRSGAAQGFLLCYTSSVLGCGLCSSCHVLRAARLLARAMVQLVHQHRVRMTLSECCQGPVLCFLLELCLLSAALIAMQCNGFGIVRLHCSPLCTGLAMLSTTSCVEGRTTGILCMLVAAVARVCCSKLASLQQLLQTLGCAQLVGVLFTIKPLARAAAANCVG
eukprot:GHRQ01013219.1.p1 GENE.GHRQ01013219.1~~GHRQ01013219.1.p1  ORF type:complete len:186 (+),score=11.58 GHRQ01013219.1:1341-1898(+)